MSLNLQPLPTGRLPKAIPATELKNKLGAVNEYVLGKEKELVITFRGVPKVVLMPFKEYENFTELREEARRKQAIEDLRQLQQEVQARNKDLSEKEAEKLGVRFSRDLIKEVVKKRKAKYG